MGEVARAIWAWLTRKEKASVALEGFNLLSGSQRDFNEQILHQLNTQNERLDECDQDRADLRTEVNALNTKVAECDEDRKELRDRIETLEQQSQ